MFSIKIKKYSFRVELGPSLLVIVVVDIMHNSMLDCYDSTYLSNKIIL